MMITILSKILGFGREISLSYFYGASHISDAFFISLTIHDVIFAFIGIGITTGYIPLYTKIANNEGETESKRFTSNLINILLMLCASIVLFVELFPVQIVKLFAVGFQGESLELAIKFTRITIVGICFSTVIAILSGFLQIKNKFIITAVLGFIFNIVIIVSVFVSHSFSVLFLAVGNVIALLLQLLLLVFVARKADFKPGRIIHIKDKNIILLGKMALPLIIGTTIYQINVIVDKAIASQLGSGGISAINYADRVNSFLLSAVVMSISVAIFPVLSKTSTENKIDQFKNIISKSLVIISLLMIPATVGIMTFSTPIVNLLFARGAFDSNAVSMTSIVLFYYCIGMVGFGLREILSKAFYSMHDTRTPMLNAAIGLVLHLVLSLTLSQFMGLGGIALASSVSATVTTGLLLASLRKKIGALALKGTLFSILKVLIASVVMGGIARLSFYYLQLIELTQNFSLITACAIGAATYFIAIYFMKVKEIDMLAQAVKRKVGRIRGH